MSQLREWPRVSQPRAWSRHEEATPSYPVLPSGAHTLCSSTDAGGLHPLQVVLLQQPPAGAVLWIRRTAAVTEGRPAPPSASQSVSQRWRGWSCEQPGTAVTRCVCLLPARHDTTFPRQLHWSEGSRTGERGSPSSSAFFPPSFYCAHSSLHDRQL